MRRLVCITLLVAMLVVITTGVVSASSQSVTVTANPKVFVTTGLTATYINDYEIGLSWIIGANVTNVMVRSKFGSVPKNRNEGNLVYYGNATNVTDFLVSSLAFSTEPLYYGLWSQRPDGGWWEDTITAGGDFMSSTILFIVVAILALGLSLGYTAKMHGFLAYAATAFWLFLGLLSYQTSKSPDPLTFTDVYMGLFWVCIGMTITFALLPTLTREKPEIADITEEWEGEDLSTLGFGKEEEPKVQPRRLRSRFGETGIM